ncbi:hypothetical protein [Kribbella swartbergensis]
MAQEYAIKLDLDVAWDIGAPMPFVMSNGPTAVALFYERIEDPNWDGTSVTVVDPGSAQIEQLGIIEFDGLQEMRFGGLNDEAVEGHPLWGRGLEPYAAHQVINSSWIAEAERRNSVHPGHRGGWHEWLKHYVLLFHDETLECLAEGFRITRASSAYSDAVVATAARLSRA